MFFHKQPHPANFRFADAFDATTNELAIGKRKFKVNLEAFEGGVHRLRMEEHGVRYVEHLTEFTPPQPAETSLKLTKSPFGIDLAGFIASPEGMGFGVCGDTWLMALAEPKEALFFGLGEKNFDRMERSGLRTRFWNTDVWSDFHWAHWGEHPADPSYFTTPYLIVKSGETYLGILLTTPYPSFFETPGKDDQRVFVEWQRTYPHLLFGAQGGKPDVWFLVGPTLSELTQKLQKLVGTTPLPPLWALGYHQSKWGYASDADLLDLDKGFTKSKTPCSGLWLDIDYMRGYRVFTVDESRFPNLKALARKLDKTGRKIIPILDPGVKFEPGYAVYDDGKKRDVFCKTPEGSDYVGLVWPGETVFPDFTQKKARDWWAGYVRQLGKQGIEGCWIDMNDPSTGPVDPNDMLFRQGRESHAAHRNEYSLGMQMATRAGFEAAHPGKRVFILSRSGFTGTSRYSAIWSGDNCANYFYLRMSIPCALGMSLSGQPFNGADLGGFGGDPTDQLLLDWTKAHFLFPFLRNHSGLGTPPREPFNRKPATAKVMRRYIRLRQQFMPTLYNLFIDQEETGAPMLRPLMFEFDADADLAKISDQFLVGPSLLQAPLVTEKERTRLVHLPKGKWFDACTGDWVKGDVKTRPAASETPLYVREGSVVALWPEGGAEDLREVELHLFIAPKSTGETSFTYRADDGATLAYQKGVRSSITLEATWDAKKLTLKLEPGMDGFGPIHAKLIVHGGPEDAELNGKRASLSNHELILTGDALTCREVS